MKPLRKLVSTVHGSHLYGTSTPTSDEDYKGVHLPSGRGIILQKPENVLNESIVSKDANKKNTQEAVDRESYSVEKFCRMLAGGDGVATEILFAPDEFIVEADPMWEQLRIEARSLLTRDVRGFAGYCKQQAAKYGVKGSRVAAIEGLVALLKKMEAKHGNKIRLEVIEDELREYCDKTEMANMVMFESGRTKSMLHVECCDRKISMRNNLEMALDVYGKVWKNYGERARKAKDSNGVDWKAVSHAVRVARQAHELMRTGEIVFPRPDAEELLAIKLGKFHYKTIEPMLEELVDGLETIDSVLPERPNEEAVEEKIHSIVLPYYQMQV
tara:strand:+ start:1648 stop:2631 length:984 start_codon:yes stop_codon:yes gene_type:complete